MIWNVLELESIRGGLRVQETAPRSGGNEREDRVSIADEEAESR